MNCAYGINLSRYSPFLIYTENPSGTITYYDVPLGSAAVEADRLDGLPHTDRRILYLATDRLRIKLVAGCEYKNIGRGC